MKKLVTLLWILSAGFPSQAQFGKILKDIEKGVKDVKKSANDATRTAQNTQKGMEDSRKTAGESFGNSPKKEPAQNDLPAGRDFYISPTGNGREATKNQPAKELAVVIPQLQAGDRIHIAAGTYLGATERGSDIFDTPVSIIGGYSPDFSSRDPWGKYRTLLTGTNEYMKESTERIGILTDKKFKDWNGTVLIDGLVIDNGPRNRYVQKKGLYIHRKANEATGENPSPETPGIKIRTGANTKVIIKNCVVTNTAPTQGAIDVQIGKNGTALIENNAVINNTGEGIMCKSLHQGNEGIPQYTLRNNTILFCWKHDEIASYGGNCIMMDGNTMVTAEDNVLGFADFGGVNNVKQCKNLTLKGNLFIGHKKYDYKEYNTMMKLDEMDDYGQFLKNSNGNFTSLINVLANKQWAELYMTRKDVNRGEIEANVKVSNGKWNQVRGILGLPLQGSSQGAAAEVWLHQLPLDDALRAGSQPYEGKGSKKP
ncbi:MAG: right-handed parallel beta-helix repeat-containing protein [Spirosomataceae bacterium]